MAAKGTTKARKATEILDDLIPAQVESLNEMLEKTESAMEPFRELEERRNRILRARDALLGGNKTTGAGSTRLRGEAVLQAVKAAPGGHTVDLAADLGATKDQVYGHLQRYRGDRVLTDGQGHWWYRDPKNGFNTIEDYDEEE